jgi:fibronectin-binding autotransporter adhesin
LNYASKFDGKLFLDGAGTHANGYASGDSVSPHTTHAPADAIIVPDAHLLFNGDFKRSGVDLILSADDQKLVLNDYFKGEKRAALASPDGAHLTGDIVKALAGHVEYAQADGSASVNKVIGHVTKLAGTATAIRNGVSIILNQGDNVEKGDVVQSGSGSTLGITFIDGTVFGLSSNARMVLNEMVYDPNGSNNSSLLSLVAGTITFVAGETAKHGDMKIDTPVATMGIRGTAVLVEIDFDTAGQNGLPDTKFQVLVEPDGTTGSYILFDKVTLTPFAIVDKAGTQFSFSNGSFNQSLTGLTPEVQKLITDVFAQRFSDNTNTKTFDHHSDFSALDTLPPIKVGNITITQTVLLVNAPATTSTPAPTGSGPQIQHIDGPPSGVIVNANGQASTDFKITEIPGVTGSTTPDKISGQVHFVDINAGDQPSVSAKFDGSTYTDPHGNTLLLNAQQLADIKAVEVDLAVTATPGNTNNGSASWSYTVPDGSFDFLAAGETLQLTYTLTVDNNYAPHDESTPLKFTITITGTNDVPVITTGAQTINFTGGKGTTGGDLAPTSETSGVNVLHPTALSYSETGTFTFTDPDLTDTHSIVIPGQTGDLTGASLAGVPLNLATFQQQFPLPFQIFENALSASVGTDSTGTGTGTINWTFAELPAFVADFIPSGETLTLLYTVEVKDSQGAISTQTITVTVTGNDTPAVVWKDTAAAPPSGALWSDGSNWSSGNAPTINDDTIIITNQLQPNFPTYPVVIDSTASAKTLAMNDVTGKAPELDNNSTLTIAGGLNLNVDATLKNFGNITVGTLAASLGISGLAEILNHSVLDNSGTINLAQGGDFLDQSTITNSGTIEISRGTLDIEVAVANAGGVIQVDSGANLKLSGSAINGGTITNNGTIDVAANSSINGITAGIPAVTTDALLNNGDVTIENGITLTLDNITVSGTTFNDAASGAIIQVDNGQVLTLNDVTINGGTFNDNGTVNVDAANKLKLNGVALSDGSITNAGTIEITGTGSINNDIFSNAQLTVDAGQILTLNGTAITGGIVTDGGTINVDATDMLQLNGVALSGGEITNAGTIEITGTGSINDDIFSNTHLTIDANQILTLDGASIIGGTIGNNGTINIDATNTLKLSGVALSGGTITTAGTIDVTSDSSINGVTTGTPLATTTVNAILNGGMVTVESSATLTLDNVTVNGTVFNDLVTGGTIQIDSGDTLAFNGATINGGTLNISGELDSTGNSFITGATIVNDNHINVVSGTLTIDPTPVTNIGTIEVQDGSTLVLSGEVIANSVTTDGVTTKGIIQVDATDAAHFATLHLDGSTIDGGTLTVSGELDSTGDSFITGVTITNTGTIDVTGGTLTIDATSTFDNTHGVLETSGGHLTINAAIVGNLEIKDGAVLELGSSLADAYSQVTVTFDPGAMGTLKLDHSQHFGGTISGFGTGDVIDLADLTYSSTETYVWNSATNTLTISDGTQTETLKLAGTYSQSGFVLESDANGNTELVTSPPVIAGETNPPTETVILAKSLIVLASGVDTNSLHLGTESFDSLSAGSISNNGFGHGSFFSSDLDATFTASGDAGVVHGSSGVSAAPFMGPVPGQADTANYLSIGANGAETIFFASEQNDFGLYWGSVDSFNTINFYNGTTLVASYSGADVAPLLSNGNQGSFASNGYVEFLDLSPFNKVVLATGGSNAFEIDNVSAGLTSDSHIQLATPITGTITVSDAVVGDTLTASVIGEGVVKYDGSTTLPADANVAALIDPHAITFDSVTTTAGLDTLNWTYNPTNADLDFLEPNDTLTVTFEAQVSDGHATTIDQPLTVTVVGAGASVVNGTAKNDTFINIGGNVTIFGNGGQDTFVFKPNFGNATIGDFNVNNDTINIDHTLFANVSALLAGAQPANAGHDIILTDAAHDTITLKNLSLTQLQLAAQHGDFHFT